MTRARRAAARRAHAWRSRGARSAAGAARGRRPLIAVGDIASCASHGDEQTAALVSTHPRARSPCSATSPTRTAAADDFANCFDPSWGALVPRIRAALGNHEYNTGTAAVAIDRFRLPPNGWYSYALGAWHVIVLNSNCGKVGGCERGSPQWRWLRADLAAHPTPLHARLLAPPAVQLGPSRLRSRRTRRSGISSRARRPTSSSRGTTTTTSASRRSRASGRSSSAPAARASIRLCCPQPGSVVRSSDDLRRPRG